MCLNSLLDSHVIPLIDALFDIMNEDWSFAETFPMSLVAIFL